MFYDFLKNLYFVPVSIVFLRDITFKRDSKTALGSGCLGKFGTP